MKTLLCAVAIAGFLFASAASLDGFAAKVNGAVITIGDVLNEMRRVGGPQDDFRTAYSNAVEDAVNRRLILNAAADKKLDMQEWLVDNRIREIVKDNFGGDMNKLNAQLAQSKVPLTDWRNQIRDDMIVNAMRFQMVDKGAEATPAAMHNEYLMHRDRYCAEAKSTVSVILLRPPPDDKTPPVTTRGEEILGRLEKGESFAELAKAFSSDSHAKDGGLWKDVKPEEAFRPEIAQAISRLKVGEYSRLINLDGWGFIVRKDAEATERQLTFEEAYDKIAVNVRRELVKARHAAWIARLREEAFVKIYPIPDDAK
ncbi:MAG: peptidylprolyl isomerase [Kiritimatiellia bacterium]